MNRLAFRLIQVSAAVWSFAGLTSFVGLVAFVQGNEPAKETVLFQFDDATSVADWQPVKLSDVESEQPATRIEIAPAPDLSATAGSALKLTFTGGDWPAVVTARIPVAGNWQTYHSIMAQLTVDRPSVAYFRILQSKLDD